ncbi:MAG: hypothetical protein U5K56_14190 [Halioglobus sp.]|nr:hypothetical protein [Halioglobus sp.]
MRTNLRAVAIASVRNRTPCVVLALLLSHGSPAWAQDLLLTFASGLPSDTTHSTQAVTSLTTVDGRRVVLARSEGTDYESRASRGFWSWTQVQQIPRDATHLAVTPTRQGDDVVLDIQYSSRKGDEAILYSSTVKGRLGQWIPLLQPADTADSAGGNHYSTATQRQRLAVKVEPAGPL